MGDRTEVPAVACISRVIVPEKLVKREYGAHRLFWNAFPGCPTGVVQPFLFRQETAAPVNDGEAAYIIQSRDAPAWDEVMGIRVVSCSPVETTFRRDDLFWFRLLASPVRRFMHPEKIRERGHEVVKRVSKRVWVEDWMLRRADQGGFQLIEMIFDLSTKLASARNRDKFELPAVQFDGLLKVSDPARFADAWRNGIGTKKSFGFGLLSIKRYR